MPVGDDPTPAAAPAPEAAIPGTTPRKSRRVQSELMCCCLVYPRSDRQLYVIRRGAGQTPNLVVEVSPVLPGGFVGQPVQLDTSGTPGALFGIVATVDGSGNQLVYFNDDNTSTVMLLTK